MIYCKVIKTRKKHSAKKAELVYTNLNDSSLSQLQKSTKDLELDSLNKTEINSDKKFVVENVNTLVGTHVFLNSFYAFDVSDKEEITALFSKETIEIKRIKEIIADIKIEKRLSIGNTYINFKLPGLTVDSLALSDLVGKTYYVLVNFWASWCGPCIQSLSKLKTIYHKYKGSYFKIVGVSLDDNQNSWEDAVNSHKLDWKHMSDLKGWKCAGSKSYAVNSIPCTFLIDKKGIIVGRNLSISEIEKLLQEKVAKN